MQLLDARLLAVATRLIVSDRPHSRDQHLTSDDVAAYLNSRWDGSDRGRIEAHLSECDACRAEVLEVQTMVRSAPRSRSSKLPVLGLLGAAAALLFIAVAPWRHDQRGAVDVVAERSVVPDAARDSVSIVSPAIDAAVTRTSMAVTWRRGPSDAQFTVTLLNTRGDILWSKTTRDTVVSVPDSVAMAPSGTYIVYVDALRVDGTSARSAARPFTVR